jgi:peptidyl-prolyl cis-trans isomerase C
MLGLMLIASCDYPEFDFTSKIDKPSETAEEGSTKEVAAENIDYKNTFAIINGMPVPRTLYSLYEIQRKNKRPISNKKNEQAELENEFINMELLAQDAIARSLDKNDEINNHIELQKKSILVTALVHSLKLENPVTDKQLNIEYNKKYKQTAPVEYSTRHILVQEENLANKITAELAKGANFAELAKQHSIGPAAKEGGALEWFKPQDIIPEFSGAVNKLSKGQHTLDPVNSRYGWHIILLEDTREGKIPELDQVKNRLIMDIEARRLEQHIQELRKEAKINILSNSGIQ